MEVSRSLQCYSWFGWKARDVVLRYKSQDDSKDHIAILIHRPVHRLVLVVPVEEH